MFMKKIFIVILAAIMLMTCVACNTGWVPGQLAVTNPPLKPTETPGPTMPTQAPAVHNSSFDDALTAFLDNRLSGNYMVSSLSLKYALGILLEGASGETRDEILRAFGMSMDEFHAFVKTFNTFIVNFKANVDKKNGMRKEYGLDEVDWALEIANSIWKRDDISDLFKPDYEIAVDRYYKAEYFDFNKGNFASKVNPWCDEKTHGMIPKLVSEGYDTGDLAIMLMNALYFKSAWIDTFLAPAVEGEFTTQNGSIVTKEFLNQTHRYKYYSDEETTLVCLPMEGDVDMIFVLGSNANIQEKIAKAEYREVSVHIPKIDLETSFDQKELVDFLISSGVKFAFNSDYANFEDMIDYRPIYIGDIIQKTKLKLDENGVEAAAVTAIMMDRATAIDDTETPVEFNADKPFSFFIIGGDTVMFNGRIVE